MQSSPAIQAHRTRRPVRGFTLFECLVAMAILLIGLLGVVTMFSIGMHARLLAQELVVSQELANMWASWVRFRMDDTGTGPSALKRVDLQVGKRGQFFNDTGDFHAAPGDFNNLPTFGCNTYRGFAWEITQVNAAYKPRYLSESSGSTLEWDKRIDGNGAIPAGMTQPLPLSDVELTISRGVRVYRFNFVFSGIGLEYGNL